MEVKRLHCSYWAYPTSFLTGNHYNHLIHAIGQNQDGTVRFFLPSNEVNSYMIVLENQLLQYGPYGQVTKEISSKTKGLL